MFLRIRKLIKLMKFLDNIEIKTLNDNTLHVKVKGNLVVQTTGDQLFCSEEGQSFQIFNTIHMNPKVNREPLFSAINNSGEQNLDLAKNVVLEHAAKEYLNWQNALNASLTKTPEPEKVKCDGTDGCC